MTVSTTFVVKWDQVHIKECTTFRSLLVSPEDKDITQKCGVIYRYKCDRLECDEDYLGESARILGERLKEHFRALSPIYDHTNSTGHLTSIDNFSIVGRE